MISQENSTKRYPRIAHLGWNAAEGHLTEAERIHTGGAVAVEYRLDGGVEQRLRGT